MKLIQAIQAIEEHRRMNLVHVQSLFPQEDIIALKEKAHESSIKEAISKAVRHYLKCKNTDEDDA
jgi:translation initiation factor 2 beta subunit (eIF-2beta)/eIF-5